MKDNFFQFLLFFWDRANHFGLYFRNHFCGCKPSLPQTAHPCISSLKTLQTLLFIAFPKDENMSSLFKVKNKTSTKWNFSPLSLVSNSRAPLFEAVRDRKGKKETKNKSRNLGQHSHFSNRGGGGTPLFRLYGYVPLDRVWFCPKQGMVLRAESLKHRLQAVTFFSSPATWALREVERASDFAADKQRVSFPDLHNLNWPLPGHYNVINQHQIIFWTRMLIFLKLTFNWLTLPLDSEDGFRTGCPNVSTVSVPWLLTQFKFDRVKPASVHLCISQIEA